MTRGLCVLAVLAGAAMTIVLTPPASTSVQAAAPAPAKAFPDLTAAGKQLQADLAAVPDVASSSTKVVIAVAHGAGDANTASDMRLLQIRVAAMLNSSPLKNKASFVQTAEPLSAERAAATRADAAARAAVAASRAAAAATRAATRAAAGLPPLPPAPPPRARAAAPVPPAPPYVMTVDAHRTAATGPLLIQFVMSKTGSDSPLFTASYEIQQFP